MVLTKQLQAYLLLEKVVFLFEDVGESLADDTRDVMDLLWYTLTPEEHQFLNDRGDMEEKKRRWLQEGLRLRDVALKLTTEGE